MVIGGKVDEQLAPYDENIELETPVVTGEVSEEEKQSMIDYYKKTENGGLDLPFDKLYADKGAQWDGNRFEKRDDKWVVLSRYNPNSKWDWYQLGGRWKGFLKLKEGTEGTNGEKSWSSGSDTKVGYCDVTIKQNIDIEGMRDEKGKDAGEYYDKVISFIKDTPVPTKWSEFIERVNSDELKIDDARALYHGQERLKKVNTEEARKELGYFVEVEDFDISREEYVQNARNKALSTYAIVKDGEWYQKGEMGWFGMSNDEMTQEVWDNKVTEMFNELPDDTLISIIDCHI
jgi:hypothetical protein